MNDEELARLRAAKELLIAEEVLSVVRHDVRNKLAAIRQAAYYLRAKTRETDLWATDPKFARFFDLIDAQVDATDAAFGAAPFLDRLHTRAPVAIGARALVASAIEACETIGGVRVAPAADVEDVVVWVDPSDVTLALVEILKNAAEATPPGAAERPVVSGARSDDLYVFSVVNVGPAFDAKVFRDLSRGFTSSREDRRGIGLSIARHVATRWGGALALRAGTGRTTIDFSVRVEPTDPLTGA